MSEPVGDDEGQPLGAPHRITTWWVLTLTVVATLAAGIGLFAIGRTTALAGATPTSDSAAAGFLRDMQIHHAQAVEMSIIVRDRTDDEDVRLLALDILTGQNNQAGQMYGLLVAWDLPQSSPQPSMAWMDDGGQMSHESMPGMSANNTGDARMPGMATPEQLRELATLEGVAAERKYLELMIVHHMGGVEMARAIMMRTDERDVVTMARGIAFSQASDIELMTEMLAKRGGVLN